MDIKHFLALTLRKRAKVAKPSDTQLQRRVVKIIIQPIVFEIVYSPDILE